MPKISRYRAPRGVVVLCHGLFGFDKMGPSNVPWLQVHYWRNIPEALRQAGCRVHVARVGRVDSLPQRAQQLYDQLNEQCADEEVHLVAHSMGGLDGRFMLSHLAPQATTRFVPRTLTTICTPHRGTPFMDWLRDVAGLRQDTLRRLQEQQPHPAAAEAALAAAVDAEVAAAARESSGAASPSALQSFVRSLGAAVDAPAFANLTTDYCTRVLNPATPDARGVRYYSYGAARQIPFWHTLYIPSLIIRRSEGDNDGLVSVQSARWGEYLGTVPCDHWDLNDRWHAINAISPVLDALPRGLAPSRFLGGSPSGEGGDLGGLGGSSGDPGANGEAPFDCIQLYLKHVTRLADDGF